MDRQGLRGESKPPLVDSIMFQLPTVSTPTVRSSGPNTLPTPSASYESRNQDQDHSSDTVPVSDVQTQVSSDYLFYNMSVSTGANKGFLPASSSHPRESNPSTVQTRVTLSPLSANLPKKGLEKDETGDVSESKKSTAHESKTRDAASEKAIPNASTWKPDVYVESFVPDSFQGVNQSVAIPVTSIPLEVLNFPGYISTFAGTQLLSPYEDSRKPPSFSGNWPMKSIEDLCPRDYDQHLLDCVVLDRKAQAPALRTFDLFGIPLVPVDAIQEIYKVQVLGIREGTPQVALGDIVLLRQLVFDPVTGLPRHMSEWFADEGYAKNIPAPGFTGYELSAVVLAIDKRYETIFIRASGLLPTIPPICNISFIPSGGQIKALQRAVVNIGRELSEHVLKVSTDTRNRSWLQYMLFPQDTDGHLQTTLPSGVFERNWFDRSLNYEQMVFHVLD